MQNASIFRHFLFINSANVFLRLQNFIEPNIQWILSRLITPDHNKNVSLIFATMRQSHDAKRFSLFFSFFTKSCVLDQAIIVRGTGSSLFITPYVGSEPGSAEGKLKQIDSY